MVNYDNAPPSSTSFIVAYIYSPQKSMVTKQIYRRVGGFRRNKAISGCSSLLLDAFATFDPHSRDPHPAVPARMTRMSPKMWWVHSLTRNLRLIVEAPRDGRPHGSNVIGNVSAADLFGISVAAPTPP